MVDLFSDAHGGGVGGGGWGGGGGMDLGEYRESFVVINKRISNLVSSYVREAFPVLILLFWKKSAKVNSFSSSIALHIIHFPWATDVLNWCIDSFVSPVSAMKYNDYVWICTVLKFARENRE